MKASEIYELVETAYNSSSSPKPTFDYIFKTVREINIEPAEEDMRVAYWQIRSRDKRET